MFFAVFFKACLSVNSLWAISETIHKGRQFHRKKGFKEFHNLYVNLEYFFCHNSIKFDHISPSDILVPLTEARRQRIALEEAENRRTSSRGLIPKAKVKTIKMTFVIIFGKEKPSGEKTINWILNLFLRLESWREVSLYLGGLGFWLYFKPRNFFSILNASRIAVNNISVVVFQPQFLRRSIKAQPSKNLFFCSVFVLCWSPYIVFDLLQVVFIWSIRLFSVMKCSGVWPGTTFLN